MWVIRGLVIYLKPTIHYYILDLVLFKKIEK